MILFLILCRNILCTTYIYVNKRSPRPSWKFKKILLITQKIRAIYYANNNLNLCIIYRWIRQATLWTVRRFTDLPWKNLVNFALLKMAIFALTCETITRTCQKETPNSRRNAKKIATIPVLVNFIYIYASWIIVLEWLNYFHNYTFTRWRSREYWTSVSRDPHDLASRT